MRIHKKRLTGSIKNTTLRRSTNSIDVELTVGVRKEGRYFVAYCPALELSSYGKNHREAQDAFAEALAIFFEETVARNSLERELLSLGWTLQQRPAIRYEPPKPTIDEISLLSKSLLVNERVTIPVPILSSTHAVPVNSYV